MESLENIKSVKNEFDFSKNSTSDTYWAISIVVVIWCIVVAGMIFPEFFTSSWLWIKLNSLKTFQIS